MQTRETLCQVVSCRDVPLTELMVNVNVMQFGFRNFWHYFGNNFTLCNGVGLLSNGYQQAQANYPIGSGGNNLSQMGVPRMSSQMIPTPGFNNNSGNHSYGSVEATNNGGRMSIVDSPMVSQDAHQKLHVSNQNSRVLHALGSQAGGAIRSGIQQKSYGFSNGALNGGLGMIGSNLQMSNGPSTSEGFLNASPYINSPKPLQHQFDQYQRSSVQGTP